MYRSKFPRFFIFLFFALVFLLPIGFLVMTLWNTILVTLMHLPIISFWQALGLFLLSRILFGGFPGKPGWSGHRRRAEMQEMRNKWFQMTPEEKTQFKQDWKTRHGRCGGHMPSTTDEPAKE